MLLLKDQEATTPSNNSISTSQFKSSISLLAKHISQLILNIFLTCKIYFMEQMKDLNVMTNNDLQTLRTKISRIRDGIVNNAKPAYYFEITKAMFDILFPVSTQNIRFVIYEDDTTQPATALTLIIYPFSQAHNGTAPSAIPASYLFLNNNHTFLTDSEPICPPVCP